MKIQRSYVIGPQNNLEENPFSVSPDLTPDHNLHKLIRKLIRRKQSIFRNREFLDFNNLDLTPLANYKHLNFWEFAKSRNLIDSKIECINFSGSNLTGLDLSIPSPNFLACNFDRYDSPIIDLKGSFPTESLNYNFYRTILTSTNLSGLNFRNSDFRYSRLQSTNIEFCSFFTQYIRSGYFFTNKICAPFHNAILTDLKIGRGIFIDGVLVRNKAKIKEFFKNLGALSVSFDPYEELHRPSEPPALIGTPQNRYEIPFLKLLCDRDLKSFVDSLNLEIRENQYHLFDFELGSANDTKFFTELACEKYSQGSNLKRLLQFLEFINKTSILNTPYDNTFLIHLAKSLNPNSLKLQDLVDEITSGITDTRVKKFMSLVCSNYLFRFYVTDKFLRRLFPD